jgi:putative FmdB family regulatory protein
MPLYEYECQACAHRFEVIQKFSDAPPAECPRCGGPVEKLLSSPAIQFKGSGFYLTDYGRGGKSDTAPGQGARSESGDKADKADTSTSGESSGGDKKDGSSAKSDKKDGASAKSSGSTGAASGGDSKPAAPAAPKSDS